MFLPGHTPCTPAHMLRHARCVNPTLAFVAIGSLLTALGGCASADSSLTASEEDELASAAKPLRIDVGGLDCPAADKACPAGLDKCQCMAEFDALNYAKPHFIAVSSTLLADVIHARGNSYVAYDDTLNDPFIAGHTGSAGASELMDKLSKEFAGSIPKYVLLNEISKTRWKTAGPKYRRYVVDFVTDLAKLHKRVPIVCSPFGLPFENTDGADWADIARVAFVADEIQVSGADAKSVGFSLTAIRKMYEDSIASYDRVGVQKKRLLLLDNFAQMPAGTTFGRDGVGEDDWRHTIQVRAAAASTLNAAGYVSYGWAGNQLHATSAKRIDWIHTYSAANLP